MPAGARHGLSKLHLGTNAQRDWAPLPAWTMLYGRPRWSLRRNSDDLHGLFACEPTQDHRHARRRGSQGSLRCFSGHGRLACDTSTKRPMSALEMSTAPHPLLLTVAGARSIAFLGEIRALIPFCSAIEVSETTSGPTQVSKPRPKQRRTFLGVCFACAGDAWRLGLRAAKMIMPDALRRFLATAHYGPDHPRWIPFQPHHTLFGVKRLRWVAKM